MWIESGANWKPVAPGQQVDTIKPGIYQYRASIFGWYLERIRDKFEFPFRIFHFDDTTTNRICAAWSKLQEGNLGILLNGVKGTGKTVSAQLVANEMIARGLPVILVNDPVPMSDILEEIHQEVVLFYDEFEKTHKEEADQQRLLSVLDGVSRSKYRRMYLLVTNKTTLDDNLLDRPGRIRYKFEYSRLAREHLNLIVEAYLDADKMHLREQITGWLFQRAVTTVDAAIKTIEEVNAFGQAPSEFESFFNLSEREATTYRILISDDGKDWEEYSENFYFYDRNKTQTLKAILAKNARGEVLLSDPRHYQTELSFMNVGRDKMFIIQGATDIPDTFTGLISVRADQTWLKDLFKKANRSYIGDIEASDLKNVDVRPEGWKPPVSTADIVDSYPTSEASELLSQLDETGTVYGGTAKTFFIRIEPVYFNMKVSHLSGLGF